MGATVDTPETKKATYSSGGRWIYILLVLTLMHVLLDARTLFVQLFPTKPIGFAFLALAYLFLGLALMAKTTFLGKPFNRLNNKFRKMNASFFNKKPGISVPFVFISAAFLTLLGILLRWFFISKVAIDPNVADMLPLIQGACDNLMSGANPYLAVYKMPWELPLTFWPGLWLPYSVFHYIGIDLRWLHMCVVIGIAAIMISILVKSLLIRSQERRATIVSVLSSLFLFLFSSELILFAGFGHTPPVWAWLSLLAAAVLAKRPYLTAIFLGILIASRQTAVVFAPLLFIFWLRKYSSCRSAIKYSLVSIAAFCIVCGPFLISAPSDFVLTPLEHYTELGQWDFTRGVDSNSAKTIGFAYLLRQTQLDWLLRFTMIVAILSSILLAWKRIRSETDLFLSMGFLAVAVTLTSPIAWTYEYFPALLIVSFAVISAGREEDEQYSICNARKQRVE